MASTGKVLASRKEEAQGGDDVARGPNLGRHAIPGCRSGLETSTPSGDRVPGVIRRSFRRGLRWGVLGGAALTAWRLLQGRRAEAEPVTPAAWPPLPDATPVVVPVPEPVPAPPWVEPVDGACPTTHPVKGKLSSRIFHVPGGFSYTRTNPDRCYLDASAAEADGLRPSKR